MESSAFNTRRFSVIGKLECEFTPEQSTTFITKSGFEVELWLKIPLDVLFLGKGVTNADGDFTINFELEGKPFYLNGGQIVGAFIKVYYRGVLISGGNPYTIDGMTGSARPIRDLILHEGLTDLGTLQTDVTMFEFPLDANFEGASPNEPQVNWGLLVRAEYTSRDVLPAGYTLNYQVVLSGVTEIAFENSVLTVKDEFVKLDIPPLPVLPRPEGGEFVVKLKLHGLPNDIEKQCYIKVVDLVNTYYSLITDLVVHNDYLCVFDGVSTYFRLADEIDLSGYDSAIYVTEEGEIFGFSPTFNRFVSLGKISFTQFQFPDKLTEVYDGLYEISGNVGVEKSGNLGSAGFEGISVTVVNNRPFLFDVHLEVFEPENHVPIFSDVFKHRLLGSKNLLKVVIGGSPNLPTDDSPDLDGVESVAGITFSASFKNYLVSEQLTTLQTIKRAGPINYLNGLPTEGISEAEKDLLQAHVDLYSINDDIDENQHMISMGYNNLFDIANTPRKLFLDDVVAESLGFYKAASVHELIVQNQKFISNLLAARMSDYEKAERVFPNIEKSTFAQSEFASLINKCDCDDCKSGISPFAYFVDLVKYGARHISKIRSEAYSPVNYTAFFSLLESYFIQPFGSLSVDCDTLHDQFCRVRLVTEVLETYVDQQSLPQPVMDKLTGDRKQFLLLTYRTLLQQMGTSYEELRDIVKTQPTADKVGKAERWSSKVGVPLEVPGDGELTADRIWLTFDNGDPNYELDGENLEKIFGFRDTRTDVLTTPPVSFIDDWKQVHLKDLWRKVDYPFTSYSREHVDPTDNNTFKEHWLPIIDPDIIGRGDLTYLSLDFAKELLEHRKAETDAFLKFYITDEDLLARTSVDMHSRILRVVNRDITTHVIEDDKIRIEDSGDVFQPFNLLNRSLVELDTDVILKKSTPEDPQDPIFQPDGVQPVMRYNRVLNVSGDDISIDDGGGPIIVTIDFIDQSLFRDVLTGGLLKLTSDSSVDVYINEASAGIYEITSINFAEPYIVSFEIPQEDAAFFAGNIQVIYEVEVPLFTAVVPNPVEICDELFTVDQSYTYLPPAPSGEDNSFEYKVWDDPGSWPSGIESGSRYEKLKALFQIIQSGIATDAHYDVITGNLYLNMSSFVRMMEILLQCENYLNSMYTIDAPELHELYDLTSIFRISAKNELSSVWIKEEIKHDPSGGTDYIELMLDGKYFWKALNEPQNGAWDPTLQTIPDSAVDINENHIPIIDPELLKSEDLLTSPDALPYRDLYFDRKGQLDTQNSEYFSWIATFNVDGIEELLNHINTGNESTPYDLEPEYNDLEELIDDFESTDEFRIHKAESVLWSAFGLTGEDFRVILPVKIAYEANDPISVPSIKELKTAVKILTSGYKRVQLYGDDTEGWIEEEVTGSFPEGSPVRYYNVMKMRMPFQRGDISRRSEWQRTLRNWNRTPTIQPDIVPPENINEFISGDTVHDVWVVRKDAFDNLRDNIESLFNDTITPDSDLLDNLELLLAMVIARTDDDTIDVESYLAYFLNLEELERIGEDIRPYLEQYGVNISAYRVLRNVYTIIKNAVDQSVSPELLDSEYTNVVDILLAIHTNNVMPFEAIQEEFEEDVILSGEYFQNYQPSLIQFPISLLDEPNSWRSPIAVRKTWKDTLESRIERSKSVKENWTAVLIDIEEITMPVMRNALIEAVRNSCETFESAQERLARLLFIETKDNCCVKHIRVSFAIETIQGFIFSLESGLYDDSLQDFSISAPNFKKEWEWIGSYATWRSAVFTYLFPENLLYPTLKRLQSPPFIELSNTIRNANRFSSEDACRAARRYQDHFDDLQQLEVKCTTNAWAYFNRLDPFDCCGDTNSQQKRYTTFYFAKSRISGKNYWSEKPYYYTDETQHSFWEALPLDKSADILGVYALARDYDENYEPKDLALWLFYSYRQEGKVILAYLKKDLTLAGSSWSEEVEITLPDLADLVVTEERRIIVVSNAIMDSTTFSFETTTKIVSPNDSLVKITACQHSTEWDYPSFIFSYKRSGGTYRHIHVRYMFDLDSFDDQSPSTIIVFDEPLELPLTGVLHGIPNTPTNRGVTVAFKDGFQTGFFGSLADPLNISSTVDSTVKSEVIGVFQRSFTSNRLVAVGRVDSGQVFAFELEFSYDGDIIVNSNPLTVDSFSQELRVIAPIFKQSNYPGGFLTMAYSDQSLVGVRFDVNTNDLLTSQRIGLSIEGVDLLAIQSADCVEDFDLRILGIKNHLRANLNAPQGNPIGDFVRTDKVKAYLYEAYYFVPKLIALDQQQRGHYEEALSWYRSVYDFTNNVNTKRKIFFGLVLEQSITNVYQRPADWLLDPLNPHLIAQTRANAYTKYTVMNIAQCLLAYADREFTMDTVESVPRARKLYTEALQLLGIKELKQKPAGCTGLVFGCFQQDVILPADRYWNNSFGRLQDELIKYNNTEEIEETIVVLKSIFDNGALSMEEKFSSAFSYVDSHFPQPTTPESTTEILDGLSDRMNNAFRFLTAGLDVESFNAAVSERIGVIVGELSKLPPEDLWSSEALEKIAWLNTPEKSNEDSFEFEFTDSSGVQRLEGEFSYDPLVPDRVPYQANLGYTNAAVLYERDIYSEPFTPHIDYRFCLPKNPVYNSLELKANLELYKIHNCRNIAGMVRELDIFAAPTDSTTGVPIIGASGSLILPGLGNFTPTQYRYRVLIERAKQLVTQAQQLESQFLAALEKEDAERYNLMKARQDLAVAKQTVKLQNLRIKKAESEKKVIDKQISKFVAIGDKYQSKIDNGRNIYEIMELSLYTGVAFIEGNIAAAYFIDAYNPLNILSTGENRPKDYILKGLDYTAKAMKTTAAVMNKLASWQRKVEDWAFQVKLAEKDIAIADAQMKVAEDNVRIVSQEREISKLNNEHAEDTLEFLRTKFTNAELYRWMGNILERTYSYMLSLATATARTAERQYYFEQQEQAGPFILDDYWEIPEGATLAGEGVDRRGLTGSARLLQDLTRLDQFAFENTKRKLEMVQTISIGQNFPIEMQSFKETGVLDFELLNRFFDYDFPGHYLRLIKSVKVSVIGLIPVTEGIKATLTSGMVSYTVIEANNTFQRIPIRRMEVEQVSLTSEVRSNGLFEFQPLQNELLNPFEGVGLESRWEFRMPKFSNLMDFNDIADINFEVEYTALDSFRYRYQVLQELDNTLDFNRAFSFKNDFPDQWYELAEASEDGNPLTVEIELKKENFPAGLLDLKLGSDNILLYFVRADDFEEEINIVNFDLASADPDFRKDGVTLNGLFKANALTGELTGNSPVMKLKLELASGGIQQEIFKEEKVTDILLVLNLKGELPSYPF